MRDFAALFTALDQSTRTSVKVSALAEYFETASEPDRLWTIAILSGRRPKRTVTTTLLRAWAAEKAGIPLWLFEEAYPVVGDLAETIALVLPEGDKSSNRGLSEWIDIIRSLSAIEEGNRKRAIFEAWDSLGQTERLVFNKLITGGFRVGVSQKLMTRALSQATGVDEAELAHRLMGDWSPDTVTFENLVLTRDPEADLSKPYPFYLAYALEEEPGALGALKDWQAEWKWDGIRGQVILRGGQYFVWSRGEELMTDRFPELSVLKDFLPEGVVLDGELLAWDHEAEAPLPFNDLQKRIGRKTVPKKLLQEAPVVLLAYDVLEKDGNDLRGQPIAERRTALETLAKSVPDHVPLKVAPILLARDWAGLASLREASREARAEGLMLKRLSSPYLSGRKKGDWWKWKVDPLTFDAVMIYAQAGHGRRATLFTDYTFAVWHDETLVPVTKAYSGLTDAEFKEITSWVKKNTIDRFGPVRSVPGELVFEIAFEGIAESPRHKSGIALRFPRMVRWRRDKPAAEADTLEGLRALL
jgi:DNA ligase 1